MEPFAAIACVHQDKFTSDEGFIRSRDSIALRPVHLTPSGLAPTMTKSTWPAVAFSSDSKSKVLIQGAHRYQHRIHLPSALILGILVSTSLCYCVLPLTATASNITGKAVCCTQATSMKHWLQCSRKAEKEFPLKHCKEGGHGWGWATWGLMQERCNMAEITINKAPCPRCEHSQFQSPGMLQSLGMGMRKFCSCIIYLLLIGSVNAGSSCKSCL